MVRPFEHLSGREFLAVVRGQRREPPAPYTFDLKGLTVDEYQEVLAARPEFRRMRTTVEWTV